MNKNLVAVLGIVALVVVGMYFVYCANENNKKEMGEKEQMEKSMGEQKTVMEETKDMIADEKGGAETKVMMDAEKSTSSTSGAIVKKETSMAKPMSTMMQKGSYDFYSSDTLALADKGAVVLFFKASWCPSCKAVDADIKANRASIKDGLTILEVDYDNSVALKQKYGVTYQHTFVQVDSKGNLLAKWSGSPTLAELETHVK